MRKIHELRDHGKMLISLDVVLDFIENGRAKAPIRPSTQIEQIMFDAGKEASLEELHGLIDSLIDDEAG
jgi:hypothetical protein